MFCQRCGKRNEPDLETCKYCSAPLLVLKPDRGTESVDLQPFLGVEDYLIDKISTVERQAHRSSEDVDLLVQAVDFLERNVMVNRAGINVLVNMLRERGLLEPKEFDRRWRDWTLRNLRDLYRKERFLDAKPHILATFSGKNQRRFEERIGRAEDLLYSLQSSRALEALEEAQTLDPNNTPLLAYLGEVYLGLGQIERAERCLSRVTGKAETSAAAFAHAELCVRQGRLGEASKRLQAILKLHPEDPEAWTLTGLVRAQEGRWPDCQRCAQKALALEDNPAAMYLLVQVHVRRGRVASAESLLAQLLEVRPDSEESLHQLALLHLARGWWGRAAEVLDRIKELRPSFEGKDLADRFRRASASRRKEMRVLPVVPERILELMDRASEEASMYLLQVGVEG